MKQKNIKLIFIFIITMTLTTNCINVKSEYNSIKNYILTQIPLNNSIKQNIDKNIFIKTFNISDELATTKIAVLEDNKLNYYNYHQWSSPLDELLTDFTTNRISSYNIFKKGVITSIFSASPDYILECKINKCCITKKFIEIDISASLYTYNSNNYSIIFINNYQKKENIIDFSLEQTSINLSKIMSEIIDNILIDISKIK